MERCGEQGHDFGENAYKSRCHHLEMFVDPKEKQNQTIQT